MQLTEQDLAEFQTAYAEAFREQVTTSEASEMASRVLKLYELLTTPLPGEGTTTLDQDVPAEVPSGQRSKIQE